MSRTRDLRWHLLHTVTFLVFHKILFNVSLFIKTVKFQVDLLQNEKVTIHLSASSNKQEGATLRHLDFIQ